MNPNRLPPLNALRAFEAAARHLSLTKAALELGVTQAAISHQVKALELDLGAPLFRRLTRALALTDTGAALAPELAAAFARIGAATRRARERDASGVLNVSLLYTFALQLVPRLGAFAARHPDIVLRLDHTTRKVDFEREPYDVAIRYTADAAAPGLHVELLLESALTPLCAPSLAKRLRKPSDVFNHAMVNDTDFWDDWRTWLAAAGLDVNVPRKHAAVFDSTRLAVEAAMEGLGIALGAPYFFDSQIASGRLVQPFDLTIPTGRAYWFVCRAGDAERPAVKAFRDWLVEEMAPQRAAFARLTPPASPRSPRGKRRR
jgi:DNA-binding transcriptional LysR family regulator